MKQYQSEATTMPGQELGGLIYHYLDLVSLYYYLLKSNYEDGHSHPNVFESL